MAKVLQSINLDIIEVESKAPLIIFPILLQEKYYNFLLDTGANHSTLDLNFVKLLGLKHSIKEEEKAVGLGIVVDEIHITLPCDIGFGNGYWLKQVSFLVLDLSNLTQYFENQRLPKVVGIFGMKELMRLGAIINLVESKMDITQ